MDMRRQAQEILDRTWEEELRKKQERQRLEQEAAEQAARAAATQEAFRKIGGSAADYVKLELNEEQQALVHEFVAAVPPPCWKDKFQKYVGPDGTVRMNEREARAGHATRLVQMANAPRLAQINLQRKNIKEDLRRLGGARRKERKQQEAALVLLDQQEKNLKQREGEEINALAASFPIHGDQRAVYSDHSWFSPYYDELNYALDYAIFADGDCFSESHGLQFTQTFFVSLLADLLRREQDG
ncbi:MAG: hypothetical protein LBJ11_00990 [Oscillospiraceae bacterium]|jgi:hypothetical protein|nr:hypothetical protein [Oscillospiraceae bacterium]